MIRKSSVTQSKMRNKADSREALLANVQQTKPESTVPNGEQGHLRWTRVWREWPASHNADPTERTLIYLVDARWLHGILECALTQRLKCIAKSLFCKKNHGRRSCMRRGRGRPTRSVFSTFWITILFWTSPFTSGFTLIVLTSCSPRVSSRLGKGSKCGFECRKFENWVTF